jgi:hypothetical protein
MDSSAVATRGSTRRSKWPLRKSTNGMVTLGHLGLTSSERAAKWLKGLTCSVNSPQ